MRGHMRDFLPLWQELVPTSADRKSHSKAGSQGCDWPRRVGGRAPGALWGRGHLSHVSETRATVPDNHRGSPCFRGSAPHPCLWSVTHGSSKESSSLGNSANGVVWRGRYTRPSWALCLRLGLLTLGLRESLTDRCRAGDDFKSPHAHVPAEARQGDARLSCFNAHALHRCPCHGLLNATPPPHTHIFVLFVGHFAV